MVGFRSSSGEYYVCGSQPYRKGMGCGSGVYVPRQTVETEVCEGLGEMLNLCTGPDGLTRQISFELRRLWQQSGSCADDETAHRELLPVEAKISNIRKAVEDRLQDASWANSRLRELILGQHGLRATSTHPGHLSLILRLSCPIADRLRS
jgi:hypothetical protein